MKLGVTVSSAAHVAILTWGLISISGPKPLMVAEVEALPVDIVPIESITRSVQGEKKADLTDKPAPKPTERPELEPAENIGETKNDAKASKDAKKEAPPTQAASASSPPEAPEAVPTPEINPDPAPRPIEKRSEERRVGKECRSRWSPYH